MDMRLRSDAVWFRPMRCRPESLWDSVFKGYPITAIGQSGVPDFGHRSKKNIHCSDGVTPSRLEYDSVRKLKDRFVAYLNIRRVLTFLSQTYHPHCSTRLVICVQSMYILYSRALCLHQARLVVVHLFSFFNKLALDKHSAKKIETLKTRERYVSLFENRARIRTRR